ncbi:hypothetical protein TA3x_005182 [Tundrisphaera sp. TA3]|uniref:hypothetical protein n=1 Tax=Tundrisphaera sp. TA3 TaxID=3435775 RepID=UPI003EB80E83
MNIALRDDSIAMKRSLLKIHRPAEQIANSARWLINGFPATVLIWTAEEWAMLSVRPNDAQPFPNGSWGALRMD